VRARLKRLSNVGLIGIFLVLNTPLLLSVSSLLNPNYSFKMTLGYSMIPTLMHGDTILIKKGAEDIDVGDIIAFRPKSLSRIVVHRVIAIQKAPILLFRTKGDANRVPDGWRITKDQVIGKVIYIVPTSLLMNPFVLFPSILLPAIWIFKKLRALKDHKHRKLDWTTLLLALILGVSGAKLILSVIIASAY
jgi:signal peptidase I